MIEFPMKKNKCVLDFYQEKDYFNKDFFDTINTKILMTETINRDVSLSLALIDDSSMKRYNAQYRNKDEPTDVLAFSEKDKRVPWPDTDSEDYLGEILISIDTAKRQAREKGHSLSKEVELLYIHGFLHLLGYDHESGSKEAKKMEEKTKEIFEN